MKIIYKINFKIPEWSLPAVFYKDYSGLFGNDVTFLESWKAYIYVKQKSLKAKDYCVIIEDKCQEPYFDNNPAFGLPCNVVDCVVLFLGE